MLNQRSHENSLSKSYAEQHAKSLLDLSRVCNSKPYLLSSTKIKTSNYFIKGKRIKDTHKPINAIKLVTPAKACVKISIMLPAAAHSKAAPNVVYTFVRCCRTTGVLHKRKKRYKWVCVFFLYYYATYKPDVLPRAFQSMFLVKMLFMFQVVALQSPKPTASCAFHSVDF